MGCAFKSSCLRGHFSSCKQHFLHNFFFGILQNEIFFTLSRWMHHVYSKFPCCKSIFKLAFVCAQMFLAYFFLLKNYQQTRGGSRIFSRGRIFFKKLKILSALFYVDQKGFLSSPKSLKRPILTNFFLRRRQIF